MISTICRVKIKQSRPKRIKTYEEFVIWLVGWLVGNFITDKEDPDGREVQTGLADQIG
jgi:hypothetical protein